MKLQSSEKLPSLFRGAYIQTKQAILESNFDAMNAIMHKILNNFLRMQKNESS